MAVALILYIVSSYVYMLFKLCAHRENIRVGYRRCSFATALSMCPGAVNAKLENGRMAKRTILETPAATTTRGAQGE